MDVWKQAECLDADGLDFPKKKMCGEGSEMSGDGACRLLHGCFIVKAEISSSCTWLEREFCDCFPLMQVPGPLTRLPETGREGHSPAAAAVMGPTCQEERGPVPGVGTAPTAARLPAVLSLPVTSFLLFPFHRLQAGQGCSLISCPVLPWRLCQVLSHRTPLFAPLLPLRLSGCCMSH